MIQENFISRDNNPLTCLKPMKNIENDDDASFKCQLCAE